MFEIFLILLSAYHPSDSGSVHLDAAHLFTLDANGGIYHVSISVIHGNVTAKYQPPGNLLIHMNPIDNGTLNVGFSQALINTNNVDYGSLSVLKNGQQTDYTDDGGSCEYRWIKIKYDQNTHDVAISGNTNGPINRNNGTGLHSNFQLVKGIPIDVNSDQKVCGYGKIDSGGFYVEVTNDTKIHHMKISFPDKFFESPFVYVTHDKKIDFNDTKYNGTHIVTFNYSNIDEIDLTPPKSLLSPLKQLKSGITAHDIRCDSYHALVTKTSDGSTACLKFATAKLMNERGWSKDAFMAILDPHYGGNTGGNWTGWYTIDVDVERPNKTLPLLFQIFNPNGTQYKTDSIPSSDIQSDGSYKYNTIVRSFFDLPIDKGFKVQITYENETRMIYLPLLG